MTLRRFLQVVLVHQLIARSKKRKPDGTVVACPLSASLVTDGWSSRERNARLSADRELLVLEREEEATRGGTTYFGPR